MRTINQIWFNFFKNLLALNIQKKNLQSEKSHQSFKKHQMKGLE